MVLLLVTNSGTKLKIAWKLVQKTRESFHTAPIMFEFRHDNCKQKILRQKLEVSLAELALPNNHCCFVVKLFIKTWITFFVARLCLNANLRFTVWKTSPIFKYMHSLDWLMQMTVMETARHSSLANGPHKCSWPGLLYCQYLKEKWRLSPNRLISSSCIQRYNLSLCAVPAHVQVLTAGLTPSASKPRKSDGNIKI